MPKLQTSRDTLNFVIDETHLVCVGGTLRLATDAPSHNYSHIGLGLNVVVDTGDLGKLRGVEGRACNPGIEEEVMMQREDSGCRNYSVWIDGADAEDIETGVVRPPCEKHHHTPFGDVAVVVDFAGDRLDRAEESQPRLIAAELGMVAVNNNRGLTAGCDLEARWLVVSHPAGREVESRSTLILAVLSMIEKESSYENIRLQNCGGDRREMVPAEAAAKLKAGGMAGNMPAASAGLSIAEDRLCSRSYWEYSCEQARKLTLVGAWRR